MIDQSTVSDKVYVANAHVNTACDCSELPMLALVLEILPKFIADGLTFARDTILRRE